MSNARNQISESLDASVRGHQVRIRVEGEGDPLLLLNGLSGPLSSWGPFIEALGERTVVTFDAPGVGESPAPILPLSIAQLAGVAVSVLDEIGLDRVDVLGYSYGGAVAQQLAAHYPQRVHRLVLAATSCGVGSTLAGWETHDGLAILMSGIFRTNALSTWWRAMAVSTWSSIAFLGAISAPTLVVCGSEDRVTPLANSQVLAGRIPNATLIKLSEGHDLQQPDAAEKFAHVVEEFLAREPSGTSEHAEL